MTKEEIIKEFIEKGAKLEHIRWARWQIWYHKVLRENCPSPELEKVLARWDRQIATPYSELSEAEKESDRKETRNYLPLLEKALAQQKEELVEKIEELDKWLWRQGTSKKDLTIPDISKKLQDIKKLIK